jgi:hypothetical protein
MAMLTSRLFVCSCSACPDLGSLLAEWKFVLMDKAIKCCPIWDVAQRRRL